MRYGMGGSGRIGDFGNLKMFHVKHLFVETDVSCETS